MSLLRSVSIIENIRPIVNAPIHRHTAVSTTLSVATVGDGTEYIITVVDTTGFGTGDSLHIENGSREVTHPKVLALTATTLTLDRRVDAAHGIGTVVTQTFVDISSVAGTLAVPIEYFIEPPVGEIWYIHRLIFAMAHGSAGDLGLFGNQAALTNGVVLRSKRNGAFGTFANWKTNADIAADMYDVSFDSRSGAGATHGTKGRGTFTNAGSVVKLDGSTGDKIQFLVQDDLTGLTVFTMQMQGYVEYIV